MLTKTNRHGLPVIETGQFSCPKCGAEIKTIASIERRQPGPSLPSVRAALIFWPRTDGRLSSSDQ